MIRIVLVTLRIICELLHSPCFTVYFDYCTVGVECVFNNHFFPLFPFRSSPKSECLSKPSWFTTFICFGIQDGQPYI